MSNSLIDQAVDINTHPDILRYLVSESIELACVVAKNPSTPPDVLEALSGYQHDPEVQRNVTANPNTPVEVLIALGAEFPFELINNPVFPLLVLENPRLLQQMPFETLHSILLLDDVPEEYLVMAASRDNSKILNIIANHPKAPFHALSQIVNNPKRLEEAYTASQHVNYSGEITEGWEEEIWHAIEKYTFVNRIKEREEFLYNIGVLDERLLLNLHLDTQLNIAANPQTPTHIAEFIINTFDMETKAQLSLNQADNPNTPVNTLAEFSRTKTTQLLAVVAENPSLPTFVLEKLAMIDNAVVKQAVYRNYNSSDSILNTIYPIDDTKINGKDIQALNRLVHGIIYICHPSRIKHCLNALNLESIYALLSLRDNIGSYIWKQLEKITDFDKLIVFARHSQTPASIFEHIYVQTKYRKNDSSRVDKFKKILRVLLARNYKVPIKILLYLVEDDCFEVRNEAVTNLKTNFALYNQQIVDFLQKLELANNHKAPSDILHSIADTKSISLCNSVANNPNTSAETLHQLALTPNHDVLIAVTQNHNISVKTLFSLSKKRKGSFCVRAHAIKALIQKDPKKAGTVLAEFVSSNEPTSPRFIFLLHPLASAKFLAQHANSICWIERYAVAQNPSTPAHVISKLTTDANRLVRAVALEKLQTL
ncbi:hypothetical protein DSM106972_097360 [Dulcicalothrix desertica PCC 7102]|uniref:Leucine rich repeat variant domain-containing protein n=1 Tax=Dulcicalothrix desertica PCC 7102 TaxID=232991 RepID=A0A433UH31_9CYAN|nr:hypothetical protein [Dulcicalothrix desertica]RUS93142.1 hypothetical protein DSM106972_097360 [Dulcicalothrix desertica PCC 7102]TWH62792.1 hypothetical protein CAL7102_00320 [Dulcicalothrix desertica PCC 7102]